MFRRVLEEVEQRILQIRKQLHEKVVKMPQSVEQQKKLIKALTSLEVSTETLGNLANYLNIIIVRRSKAERALVTACVMLIPLGMPLRHVQSIWNTPLNKRLTNMHLRTLEDMKVGYFINVNVLCYYVIMLIICRIEEPRQLQSAT